MSDVAIRSEGLGKKYLIGHQAERERYNALRDTFGRTTKNLMRSAQDMLRGRQILKSDKTEEFWALKNVFFDIRRAEVVGIIGRNGAGKSTLLKILSRITEPTSGRVEIRGRIASLLEVGTGFHPELTGRENIYLNGAILGMTRAEIRAKFNEIVAFAEVERFLDTPVKRYSSGMYVRLAFAVAAHLEPEILVIDEVLAVGDAEFQQKCLGKLQLLAQTEGRVVLFVSHNLVAVQQLCKRAILLDHGRITDDGSASQVVQNYISNLQNFSKNGDLSKTRITGNQQVKLISYRIANATRSSALPATNDDLLISITLYTESTIAKPAYGIAIYNDQGVLMTCVNTIELGTIAPPLKEGKSVVNIRINAVSFLPGIYNAAFWVMSPQAEIYAMSENAVVFEITQVPLYGTCLVDRRWGCVYSDITFSTIDI